MVGKVCTLVRCCESVHWWSVVECVCWESVSGREGDGWEDVGEGKGDANKLSCHTGTITCFHLLCMNLFINSLIQAVMFM